MNYNTTLSAMEFSLWDVKGQSFGLDDRKCPAGDGSVGARADERELARVPATLDDLVLVVRHLDAR